MRLCQTFIYIGAAPGLLIGDGCGADFQDEVVQRHEAVDKEHDDEPEHEHLPEVVPPASRVVPRHEVKGDHWCQIHDAKAKRDGVWPDYCRDKKQHLYERVENNTVLDATPAAYRCVVLEALSYAHL